MIATICEKTKKAIVFLECEKCQDRNGCQAFSHFKKDDNKEKIEILEKVTSNLEEIVKKAIEEQKKLGNREKRCDFCKCCKRIKTIRESCCDVGLYECQNPCSKKYGMKMDESHVWKNSCDSFT